MHSKRFLIGLAVVFTLLWGSKFSAAAAEPVDNRDKLLFWYQLDEPSGTFVEDSSGNGLHGKLIGGESWTSGKINGAVNLNGANHIRLPAGIVRRLHDFTFTAWVNQSEVSPWQRLFDFGNDIMTYIYFTLNDGVHSRFAINKNNSWQELTAPTINDPSSRHFETFVTRSESGGDHEMTTLAISHPGTWHFVAVSKSGSTVMIYIDGIPSATSDIFSYSPSELGITENNFIGKSQYKEDANFKGKLDDIRFYTVAMSSSDIQNIMGQSLSDEEAVALNKRSLQLENTFSVEENLNLINSGSNGVSISWKSSDTKHLTNEGIVTRPTSDTGDVIATLTATLQKNSALDEKKFEIRILKTDLAPFCIDIKTEEKGVDISPTLYGIFFEDINYALDGGAYPERVQNGSFEFRNLITQKYDGLHSWHLVETGGGMAAVTIESKAPLNEHNPNYLRLTARNSESGAGIWNTGFPHEIKAHKPGMVVKENEHYTFSMFARSRDDKESVEVSIEGAGGAVYASHTLSGLTANWRKLRCTLTSSQSDTNAKLVIKIKGAGSIDMDMISLFPQKTWKSRKNGLRRDLGKMLEEMHPKFVRFPGGCIAEGDSIENIYRWKDTVGKLEGRKMNYDLWYYGKYPHYHQSFGFGFYEYFQLCEDLKAKAIPVVNAGLTCQERSPVIIPMDQLAPFIEDTLDLIEFANGGSATKWGGLRAQMGHPEPFNLEYLAVGNENWGPVYFKRYEEFAKVIRARYPQIKLITTSGPRAEDANFINARRWIKSREGYADLVDEHLYYRPSWFYTNINRYDNYDRSLPKIILSEYDSLDNTMKNALAEAAFLMGIEENSDFVTMVSYSPLFAKQNFTQWAPAAIWFNNSECFGSANYHLQKLFMNNIGHFTLPTDIRKHGRPVDTIKGRFGVGGHKTAVMFDDVTLIDNKSGKRLFHDDFSKGSTFTPIRGEWEVIDQRYSQISTTASDTLSCAGPGDLENYTVSLKALKNDGQEGFLIYFGVKDRNNYLRWRVGGRANTSGSVEWVNDGRAAAISEFDMTPLSAVITGQWYHLKAVVSGNRLKCYINGKLLHNIVHRAKNGPLYANTTFDKDSGEIIIKVVNTSQRSWNSQINLIGSRKIDPVGTRIVLKADHPEDRNSFSAPQKIIPIKSRLTGVANLFTTSFAPNSITVFRLQ